MDVVNLPGIEQPSSKRVKISPDADTLTMDLGALYAYFNKTSTPKKRKRHDQHSARATVIAI